MLIHDSELFVFTCAALSLNLIPGSDMMYVLGQALKGGKASGMAASFGISAGSAVHLLLVALGVAVLLQQFPLLFYAIRYVGAAYLVWIAVQTLRHARDPLHPAAGERSRWAAFRDGVLVNLFNPKVIIFMFAFLPPFVRPENGAPMLQLVIFGSIFIVGGTAVNCLVALFAGHLRAVLARREKVRLWFARLSAGLFILLAARLVMERKS